MSVEELRAKLAEQREELMTARFKHATAQLEKDFRAQGHAPSGGSHFHRFD